jgi:hypothetical protein
MTGGAAPPAVRSVEKSDTMAGSAVSSSVGASTRAKERTSDSGSRIYSAAARSA